MDLIFDPHAWAIRHEGRVLVSHTAGTPCCFAGKGRASIAMYRGNFDIRDYVEERVALRQARVEAVPGGFRAALSAEGGGFALTLDVRAEKGRVRIRFETADPALNRLWLRINALPSERVWGGGEQMSYFDMRGRNFPLWTSEPGVGRDKTTRITWEADVTGRAGGDYYTTNYPQPTFLSSERYGVHADTTAYADFDFRSPAFHELQFWAVPREVTLISGGDYPSLVSQFSDMFGRQPGLPDWATSGVILGLKDGRDHAERILAQSLGAGVHVSGLWCEDWAGVRHTSFGKRLFWDWHWNERQYPGAREWVRGLKARGIRFLGYANPYLCSDGSLYAEAKAAGHLARALDGSDYLVDFGEFGGGVVDFTSPEAARWYASRILRQEMIDGGLDGWMADFGEYLPIDVRLSDGSDPMLRHNEWPVMWARVNAHAVAEAGRTGDIVFFMRAGYTGVQAHCPMIWAGDQSVDFSRHDGLQTVICAALSAGILGNAYNHSDIGGFTSLFGNRRTPELFQRWTEMAAFTPFMRTHEGNRPSENFQFWQDAGVLAHLARMTRVHDALAPLVRTLGAEAARTGLPLQRPLFLHHPGDPECLGIQDQYLYGPDLLVAPVHEAGRDEWNPYLPAGASWTHLWTGREFAGGSRVRVPAPLGKPPVFVRRGGAGEAPLRALADI
jgi:sulfoquinovosidase